MNHTLITICIALIILSIVSISFSGFVWRENKQLRKALKKDVEKLLPA